MAERKELMSEMKVDVSGFDSEKSEVTFCPGAVGAQGPDGDPGGEGDSLTFHHNERGEILRLTGDECNIVMGERYKDAPRQAAEDLMPILTRYKKGAFVLATPSGEERVRIEPDGKVRIHGAVHQTIWRMLEHLGKLLAVHYSQEEP